ncbi:predicted protein, partial [Nematostella vectensis]
ARVVLYKRGAKVLTVGFNAIDSNKMNWFSSSRLARVVLYKRGAKVLTVGFNAIDSNKMNWFSSSRLVDSPWSDLGKEPKNFFSIKGDTAHNRHFLINRSYEGGCHVDFGWLVTGQLWHCKWEQGYKKAAFLYSKIGTHTNWNKHVILRILLRSSEMKRHLLILFLALMAISADLVSGHGATNSSCDRIPRGSRRFYGRSPNMPGKSCMDILNKNLSIRNNGIYWIKLNENVGSADVFTVFVR